MNKCAVSDTCILLRTKLKCCEVRKLDDNNDYDDDDAQIMLKY